MKRAAAGMLVVLSILAFPVRTRDPAGPQPVAGSNGRYVVVLDDSVPGLANPAVVARAHARRYGVRVSHLYTHAIKGYAALVPRDRLEALRSDDLVNFVAGDGALSAAGQALPTGVDRIEGDRSSTQSGNGSGTVNVNVAVIDIGIDAAHPDLNVKGGKDCSAPGTPYNPWHGTAVAGTIAAKDDANGVVGLVPGARLYPVRVTNFLAQAPFSDVICAVDWVTGTRRDKNRTNDIAVVNMSLAGRGSDDGNCGLTSGDALHAAICNSTAAGVVYVAAAGNTSEDFQTWVPASYDEVLTVTAMADSDGKPGQLGLPPSCRPAEKDEFWASFSNFATTSADQAHTIAAPGVCILTTQVGGGYLAYAGTSMATPHVSGVAALCIARGACTGTPAQIIQKLRSDAQAYNAADILYGFWGDPLRPLPGRYYGYLIRAASY